MNRLKVTDEFGLSTINGFGDDELITKNRFGGQLSFELNAPTFVERELSTLLDCHIFNMQFSGVEEFKPTFYIPSITRQLDGVEGDMRTNRTLFDALSGSYELAWTAYQTLLSEAVPAEIARICLPVGIFTDSIVSTTPYAAIQFVNNSAYATWELNEVKKEIIAFLKTDFPKAYSTFTSESEN